MNKQQKQFALAIGLLVVLIFVALLYKQRQPTSEVISTAELTNVTPAALETAGHSNIESVGASTSPAPKVESVRTRLEKANRETEAEIAMWQAPLLYFGKVVDEGNQPISGVQVSYGANSMNESRTEVYTTGTVTTDERGIFKIDGVRGINLMVQLSHPNYYPYPENSTGFDKRSVPKKGYFSDSEENAELFRMHSKGDPVPLIFRRGGFHTPNDGTVAHFPLRGNTRAEILGQLQIQGWSGLRSDANPYDWKVQLNLPNGGIIEFTNYFDSVAPEAGYSTSVDVEVSGGEMIRKTYFLKVPAGYIRFKLEVIMGKDMFVSGDYYFNPDGSRNLEPSQEIRPTQ
jgi:hypothetical protein